MDKRNLKKVEQSKTDKKDRGDNSKKSDKVVRKSLEIPVNVKVSHLDRGDSELKLLNKPKVNETKIAKNKVIEHRKDEKSDPKVVNKGERRKQMNRPLHAVDNAKHTDIDSESKLHKPEKNKAVLKPEGSKKAIKTVNQTINHSSIENMAKNIEKSDSDVVNKPERVERRKIKEKHPLQSKNVPGTAIVSGKEEIKLNVKIPSIDVKNDRLIKKPNELKDLKNIPSIESGKSELVKEMNRDLTHRRPTIKTVTADRLIKKPNELKDLTENIPSIESGKTELVKEINRNLTHRRPIIKTVTAKINDNTKVFKAVTFVEQRQKPAPLQIKIPNEVKNLKTSKAVETNTVIKKVNTTISRVSVRERGIQKKPEKRKKEGERHVRSPDIAMRGSSPQTEVAKWAPSSINRHTKPYYEAWVSTTLAAISKNSKKDKLFLEKQNILQTFQRALVDRPETPELMYENFKDERYAGRIKVKQR